MGAAGNSPGGQQGVPPGQCAIEVEYATQGAVLWRWNFPFIIYCNTVTCDSYIEIYSHLIRHSSSQSRHGCGIRPADTAIKREVRMSGLIEINPLLLKILVIALLTLLLLVPLGRVESLIAQRAALRDGAVARVANGVGHAQSVGAMVLVVPVTRSWVGGRQGVLADQDLRAAGKSGGFDRRCRRGAAQVRHISCSGLHGQAAYRRYARRGAADAAAGARGGSQQENRCRNPVPGRIGSGAGSAPWMGSASTVPSRRCRPPALTGCKESPADLAAPQFGAPRQHRLRRGSDPVGHGAGCSFSPSRSPRMCIWPRRGRIRVSAARFRPRRRRRWGRMGFAADWARPRDQSRLSAALGR